jgi:uncharacterized membrane protein YeaQ/YmgE (transglycosylase-associated protein family)
MGLLSWLIVGAIAGYVAGMFVKGDEQLGILGHIVLGIVGALIGGFIANQVTGSNYLSGINISTIVVAVIGSIIAVFAYRALLGRGGTRGV